MWYNCDTLKPGLRGRAPGRKEGHRSGVLRANPTSTWDCPSTSIPDRCFFVRLDSAVPTCLTVKADHIAPE